MIKATFFLQIHKCKVDNSKKTDYGISEAAEYRNVH